MKTEIDQKTCKCRSCGRHFNISLMKEGDDIYTCSGCRENSEED